MTAKGDVEGVLKGYCRRCGYEEYRVPEELEPLSKCPSCEHNTFGGPEDTLPEQEVEVSDGN